MKNRVFLLLVASALLGGCGVGGSATGDLEQFVQTTLSRTPGPIDPMPEFLTYEPFKYSASGMRSPFVSLLEVQDEEEENVQSAAPDQSRPKEYLEGFVFSTLSMVGTIARDNVRWALVQDPDGNVHRVTVGNYLGRNYGQIKVVSEDEVLVTEVVPTGNGNWIERPQTLTLQDL